MRSAQLISNGSINRILQESDTAWRRFDFQQSIETLERASRLDPANVKILLILGQRYGLRYEYAKAENCFEKAIRIAPDRVEILTTAGRFSTEFSNYPMAERFLRRAMEHPNATTDVLARVAELFERLRRADDAAALAERVLTRDHASPAARLTLAKLHRQAGRLAEAEKELRPMLTTESHELKVRGYYELGAVLDRAGRYDEAMTAFLSAKALLRPSATALLPQSQAIRKHLEEMQRNITEKMLISWHHSGCENLQSPKRIALLAGHARSGTTLLEQVLDSHPDIVSAEETPVFRFDAYASMRSHFPVETSMLEGLNNASNEMLQQSRNRYFHYISKLVGAEAEQKLLIDKNPSIQGVIAPFVRIFPESKLIIALRDPRDVALSCFMLPHWPIDTGTVRYLTIEDTFAGYATVMGTWLTLRPILKNPFLEARYEDMVDDLESVARKTLDFLGVPWDAKVLGFDEHAQKKIVRSPTYADVTQPVYKRARGRWRNYQKYLEPHLKILEPYVKAFGYE